MGLHYAMNVFKCLGGKVTFLTPLWEFCIFVMCVIVFDGSFDKILLFKGFTFKYIEYVHYIKHLGIHP